jgi:hypothetical protein
LLPVLSLQEGRSPGGLVFQLQLDFQHGTMRRAQEPRMDSGRELQRERYEADMKLIPNDGTPAGAGPFGPAVQPPDIRPGDALA